LQSKESNAELIVQKSEEMTKRQNKVDELENQLKTSHQTQDARNEKYGTWVRVKQMHV